MSCFLYNFFGSDVSGILSHSDDRSYISSTMQRKYLRCAVTVPRRSRAARAGPGLLCSSQRGMLQHAALRALQEDKCAMR